MILHETYCSSGVFLFCFMQTGYHRFWVLGCWVFELFGVPIRFSGMHQSFRRVHWQITFTDTFYTPFMALFQILLMHFWPCFDTVHLLIHSEPAPIVLMWYACRISTILQLLPAQRRHESAWLGAASGFLFSWSLLRFILINTVQSKKLRGWFRNMLVYADKVIQLSIITFVSYTICKTTLSSKL